MVVVGSGLHGQSHVHRVEEGVHTLFGLQCVLLDFLDASLEMLVLNLLNDFRFAA